MSDDHTVPDLRARYSKPVDPWSTFVQHVDGPAEPPTEPRRSYRAHLGIDAMPGVSARAKATLQALWADADFGAIESGEPALVWTSAPTLAKRMGVSESTAWRGLRKAADAGLVIRLSNYIDGRRVWSKDRGLERALCRCEPGKWSTATERDCCCCRVLVPVDREGRVGMVLTRSKDIAQRDRASVRPIETRANPLSPVTPCRNQHPVTPPVTWVQPPGKGDTQPTPSRTVETQFLDRSANTADTDEPWHITHRIENDPWFD